ncbi:MAG: nickel insertion protein, partial [Bryobacteraceae bacterium]
QVLAYAMERLFERGALDVTLQPLEMKKGRPGTLLRVLSRNEDRETLAALIFAETTTLGVRMHAAERRVESRRWVEVATPHGAVRVKVSGSGAHAPEYEDCRRVAIATGVPLKQIIAEASFAYMKTSR